MNLKQNKEFGVHDEYSARETWEHFDDTSFTDEWQNEVYEYARAKFVETGCKRAIDFGCGSGFKLVKYFPRPDTIGVEVDPSYSYLRKTYPDRAWFSDLDRANAEVPADMLICSDVIEHMPNPSELLTKFATTSCRYFIISTPSLELMADKGWSPRLGPPRNPSHIREWSAVEFGSYVSRFLRIIEHRITNLEQCTQMVYATKLAT